MITYSNVVEKVTDNGTYMFIEGDGLSTDTLPTNYANKPIFNGSSIFFMDTYKLALFNQTTGTWQVKGTNV